MDRVQIVAEYEEVVRELLGEREENGVVFGGISDDMYYNGPAFFDARHYKVLVPANVRQDGFDELISRVKVADLPEPPLTITGKPITNDEFEGAFLITVRPGEYMLSSGDNDMSETSLYRNRDGTPYVFKFSDVEGMLKKRRPDLFAD